MEYQLLKHSGEVIDKQIERVINGSVVTDNTDSHLDKTSHKPLSNAAIAHELDQLNNSTMTLRGTYTATDPDSPVVWTTPYDELLRIVESMKRAEAGEDNNTLYYIVLDGPLGQLQAQLSYIKAWEMWMGEIPFTFAPAPEHVLFIIHLSITLPEDDNQRLQANCWVGRKQLPTMDRIATRFVDTEEQMLGPQGRLQARTNIGLPVHRLWMQLDRSEGVEGVFCLCKRAEGYDEENAATIAAMVAANDSDTPSHDMFLITIFDGNTAVTGELNMINNDTWGSEIILGAGFGNKLTWLFSVDAELVGQGDIDLSRVQFCNLPNDTTRSAVITGTRQLSLTSDQIAVARGNLQIYTVVCDTEGNLLTTASRSAVAKMSEVQQDPSKVSDSVFIVKLVEGATFYTVAMTLNGGYWLGATPYTRLLTDKAPLVYLLVEATIVDGVFNLTLRRPSLITSDLFETLPNGNIKVEGIGEFMAATPSGSPNHNLYISLGARWNDSTWLLNGVELTNEEIDISYLCSLPYLHRIESNAWAYLISTFQQKFKTNFYALGQVPYNTISKAFDGNSIGYGSSVLEVVRFQNNINQTTYKTYVKNCSYMFGGCPKLREIKDYLDVSQSTTFTSAFGLRTTSLETIWLIGLKANISFAGTTVLKKECLLYMIQNAAPTSAITITVHADVYAWASTDTEIQEALTAQPLVTLISA